MATTRDYLEQLESDRQALINNLTDKGVPVSGDETFTSLSNKVKNVKYKPTYVSFMNFTGTDLSNELNNLDTSNMTTMKGMFQACNKLTSIDVSGFNTSSVKSMENMFRQCSQLTEIDVSNFVTDKCGDYDYMFYGCTNLKSIDLKNFVHPYTGYTSYMFSGCTSLMYIDIRNFTFPNVGFWTSMFNAIPANCEIIVKDDAARTWLLSNTRSDLTNIKTVAEKEAE